MQSPVYTEPWIRTQCQSTAQSTAQSTHPIHHPSSPTASFRVQAPRTMMMDASPRPFHPSRRIGNGDSRRPAPPLAIAAAMLTPRRTARRLLGDAGCLPGVPLAPLSRRPPVPAPHAPSRRQFQPPRPVVDAPRPRGRPMRPPPRPCAEPPPRRPAAAGQRLAGQGSRPTVAGRRRRGRNGGFRRRPRHRIAHRSPIGPRPRRHRPRPVRVARASTLPRRAPLAACRLLARSRGSAPRIVVRACACTRLAT